jgi:thymidylate synthase ThyX
MIKAEIICDSIGEHGKRLTTFVLTYPRFVHAEFMTHRMISKNSASSRAIPSQRMIQDVMENPAEPVFWGANQAGMQASVELSEEQKFYARARWLMARDMAVQTAKKLNEIGLHKQNANRVLEPWFHMRVVASATEWENFFFLRSHPAAQPEIQALSDAMLFEYVSRAPRLCQPGEWHMPFIVPGLAADAALDGPTRLRVSVARCARVSYLNHDGTPAPLEKDLDLYDRLTSSGHWSPTEHVAECTVNAQMRSGNFRGWIQLRSRFANECRRGDLAALLKARQDAGSVYAKGPVGTTRDTDRAEVKS